MRTIGKRLDRVEAKLGVGNGKPGIRLVVTAAGGLALPEDRCIKILEEGGFLSTSPGLSLVNLCRIPDGLNAEEAERFLRENGAELCGGNRTASGR